MKRMINNAENLEHLIFIIENIDFFSDDEYTLDDKNGEPYRLAEHIRYCADYSMPCIIFSSDYDQGGWLLVGFPSVNHAQGIFEAKFTKSDENEHHMCTVRVDFKHSTLTTISTTDTFLTAADAPKMYRHNIVIRFGTDNKEVNYVVYSFNNTVITDYDKFNAVAKPISNFNYTATYVNGNNAEPAFIRFASGTILVGLSTGIEAYNSVSDTVEEA